MVLGGGASGCELSQSFARLGSQVTLVEGVTQLLGREDHEVGELIESTLVNEGVTVMTEAKALEVIQGETGHQLAVEHHGERKLLPFDYLLVSVGRQANVEGLGLEALGITTTQAGTLELNERLVLALLKRYFNWRRGDKD